MLFMLCDFHVCPLISVNIKSSSQCLKKREPFLEQINLPLEKTFLTNLL